ncbi:MAG: methylmalonyl-CoA epimerase [Desulfatiglans sp.]|jgi:methylmalonyl-CoA/ethylmalonyl-CoA epimerase|nr:methylmalonyl-CoA epimerase [Desulfatiglans sp.]
MIQKIDHIGIAVKSIEKAREYFENTLGLKCEGVETVESQKVKTAFYSVGEVHLELLEPTSEESAVAKFIIKNGEGVHHIAFKTDDIDAQLKKAENSGCSLINKVPVDGAGGKQIAFLHPKSTYGVLTEFCFKLE